MAVLGTLIEPYQLAAIDFISPIPVGNLVDPYEFVAVDLAGAPISNRFPTPPIAWGFLTDVDFEMITHESWGDPLPGGYISGALAPAGLFLEPTIGQIWPRIG